MRLPNFKKKYVAGALAAGLIMGAGGIAAAYFSASGSGTGHALVGTTAQFSVTPGSVTGLLYPNQSQTVHFDLTNNGTGPEHWTIQAGAPSTEILVATLDGNIVTSSNTQAVTGCLASWFSVKTTAQSGTIPGGGTNNTAFYATVSMSNGTGAASTQDACRGTSPKLNVFFSPTLTSAAAFDGTYTGTNYSYANLTAPSLSVSPSSLGTGKSETFTVTVHSTPNAAKWNATTAALVIAGFAKPTVVPTLKGDGSVIFAQDNSTGAGYCANDQFFTGTHRTTFVFGSGISCFTHSAPAGSTVTFSVTITGTNTFTDTITVAKTGVTPGAGFTCGTSTCSATYTGTLSTPATTEYYPSLHLLPGRTTTAPHSTWTYTVSGATYSTS